MGTTVPRPHRQHEARVALRMHTEHRFVDTERGQWGRNDSNNSSGLISYQYDTNAWYNANAFDQALHNLHNSVSSSAITRQSQRAEHQERQRHLQAEREAQEAEVRRAAETVVRAQRRAAMDAEFDRMVQGARRRSSSGRTRAPRPKMTLIERIAVECA